MRTAVVFAAILGLLLGTAAASSYLDMQITTLPGWDADLPFNMYSGYVNFSSFGAEKKYFFWFIQHPNDNASIPLQLWLNGGPGCSSLTGLLSEQGPFRPQKNGSLALNPYTWAYDVNILFLESPAGVGFSKCSGSKESCNFDDNRTAYDNYQAVSHWINVFTPWQGRDFIISGESYAGAYVPELSNLVFDKPINGLNFVGFMVGNPVTDNKIDGASVPGYLSSHTLASLDGAGGQSANLNPYDILIDFDPNCPTVLNAQYVRWPHYLNGFRWVGADEAVREWDAAHAHETAQYVPNIDACYQLYLNTYLNKPAVQSAIHAEQGTWIPCGGVSYTGGLSTQLPTYQKFLKAKNISILVYSGDADTIVNFMGTEKCVLSGLNLKPENGWKQWMYKRPLDNLYPQVAQCGGFGMEANDGWFMYRTVKGAGHMVPTFQPAPAQQLHRDFLAMVRNNKARTSS